MKTIMYCLALVAMAGFTSVAFAQEPTLTSVEAKFDTTTDNKKQDTKLDVYLKNDDGQEVGKSEGNEGLWDKHSTHTVTLQIEGNPAKAEVAHGSVSLTFHPGRRRYLEVQLQIYSQVLGWFLDHKRSLRRCLDSIQHRPDGSPLAIPEQS